MRADFCLGDWIVRPRRGCIERGEEIVHVHPKPMSVLVCLADASGEVVTRDELYEAVWPGVIVTDDSLTQCIAELRKAFGDSAKESQIIKTVPKTGFCLVPPVKDLADPSSTPANHSRKRLIAFSVVIMLLALMVSWRLVDMNQPELSKSIAVLAFVNMSDDPGNEYFSDGISEELLNLLATIPGLRVTARTSSFSFKGKEVSIADIARELNVAYILEGSVRKNENRVRVTAQLIETGSGTHVWSKTYDRTLNDIFALQDEIAGNVVDSLKITLLGEAVPKVRETDPEAYVLYLQCRHFSVGELEELRRGERYCRQSLEIDPDYAPTWERLGAIYSNLTISGYVDFEYGYEQAKEFVQHALELDPNFAGAHAGLGWKAMMYDRDLPKAAAHFQAALELAPSDYGVLGRASVFAETLGRFEQAIALADKALAVNPLGSAVYGNIAIVHCWAGQFERANERFEKYLELKSSKFGNPWRAQCYLLQGQPEKALEEARRVEQESRRLWVQSMALYDLNRFEESDRTLYELIQKYPDEAASFIAENYAWRGDIDPAFEWLNRAMSEKQYMWGSLVFDPAFAKLHSDPRWADIRARDGRSEEQLQEIHF